ncbi:MAG: hypothetical protein ACI4HI_12870 [Lachnospiraceae bacterium]
MSKNEDYLDRLLNSVSEDGEVSYTGEGEIEDFLLDEDFINNFEKELTAGEADLLNSFDEELNQELNAQTGDINPLEEKNSDYLNGLEDLVNLSKEQTDAIKENETTTLEESEEREQSFMLEEELQKAEPEMDQLDDVEIEDSQEMSEEGEFILPEEFIETQENLTLEEIPESEETIESDELEPEEKTIELDELEPEEKIDNFGLEEFEPEELEDIIQKAEQSVIEEEPLKQPETFENQEEKDESKNLDEMLQDMKKDQEQSELEDLSEFLGELGEDFSLEEEKPEKVEEEAQEPMELPDELSSGVGVEQSQEESGKKKKPGLFAKLALFFFGPEEEEEEEKVEIPMEDMTEEEKAAFEAMGGKAAKKKKKKEKKQKEKKPKKEKPKKEKKQKPPKPKKEKKPKPPKEVDHTPPLPKVPVILIFIMAFSIGGCILLGTQVIGYSAQLNQAKEKLNDENYMSAYSALNGVKVKEKDKDLYEKSALISYLQSEYDGYNTYMSIGDYEGALDCLIRGIGRYDLHYEEAKALSIDAQYDKLEGEMEQKLIEQFNVSAEKARKLYALENRRDYTRSVKKIIRELGL